MGVVPIAKPESERETETGARRAEEVNWVGMAAGGSLVAAGLLLLAGRHRAGMVAAASGTALALLDQQETLHSWWSALPGTIDALQQMLRQVEGTVEGVAAQRERLRRILAR